MNFLGTFSKKTQIPNFVKIRPVEAELFIADGRSDSQVDTKKPTVNSRNFAKESNNFARHVT
jgi:hypothetical protein